MRLSRRFEAAKGTDQADPQATGKGYGHFSLGARDLHAHSPAWLATARSLRPLDRLCTILYARTAATTHIRVLATDLPTGWSQPGGVTGTPIPTGGSASMAHLEPGARTERAGSQAGRRGLSPTNAHLLRPFRRPLRCSYYELSRDTIAPNDVANSLTEMDLCSG